MVKWLQCFDDARPLDLNLMIMKRSAFFHPTLLRPIFSIYTYNGATITVNWICMRPDPIRSDPIVKRKIWIGLKFIIKAVTPITIMKINIIVSNMNGNKKSKDEAKNGRKNNRRLNCPSVGRWYSKVIPPSIPVLRHRHDYKQHVLSWHYGSKSKCRVLCSVLRTPQSPPQLDTSAKCVLDSLRDWNYFVLQPRQRPIELMTTQWTRRDIRGQYVVPHPLQEEACWGVLTLRHLPQK